VKNNLKLLIIAIVLQLGMYFYLDKVLLVPAATFSQHIVTEGNKAALDPEKLSTDNKYYAEVESTEINFLTADNKVDDKIPLETKDVVTYFTWVPNSHVALAGISNETSGTATLTLKTINLDTNSIPVEPKVSGLIKGSQIDDVVFSPQVNVTYMQITNKSLSLVYRTDANNLLSKVLTTAVGTRIACLQNVDMLLYDNKKSGLVYSRNSGGYVKVISPKGSKYSLVGTDQNDYVYIGKLDKTGHIATVLKGSIKGDFKEYQTLINPCMPDEATVGYDGTLQVN
jgi:hypothetical protein